MSYQLPDPPVVVRRDSIYMKFVATDAVRAELEDCAGLFTADQVLAAYLAGIEDAARLMDAEAKRQKDAWVAHLASKHPGPATTFHTVAESYAARIRALAADGLVERKG